MVDVDYDKLADISEELITYEGFLPLLIRALIFRKWCKHLDKIGMYDVVIQKCKDTMPSDFDEAEKELINWCKEHKEYKDLIK